LCRLAVWTLMNVEYGNFLCWIALVCSSFSAVNVATSGRTPATPWGRTFLPYVAAPWHATEMHKTSSLQLIRNHLLSEAGNCLASRAVLLAMLCWALHGCFGVEQPRSTRLVHYPRWERFLLVRALKLWWAAWWARHYSALTPTLG